MTAEDAQQPTEDQTQEELSLSALTEAFAEVMGGHKEAADAVEPPAEPSPDSPGPVESEAETAIALPSADDEASPITPRSLLEAMLFVGNQDNVGLSARQAAELMRGVESDEIERLVEQLNQQYEQNGCPYTITEEGGRYRMTLRREFHVVRNRFYGRIREVRLSQAAVDVLAIVAYQQPLSSEQVSRLRAKPSSHVLAQLVRRGLLRIERRGEKRRRPYYFTTDRFLELFGLESLDDLPQSEELDR